MIVCHDPKFCYFAPQKTGTSSMGQVLMQLSLVRNMRFKHALHLSQLKRSGYQEHPRPDYFHFITVRDPFTRAVSLWHHILRRTGCRTAAGRAAHQLACRSSFAEFMTTIGKKALFAVDPPGFTHPQCRWLNAMPRVHARVHLENFEEDVRKLPFVPDDMITGHVNKNAPVGDHYAGSVGEAARNVVRDWYSEDFEKLGYAK